jgi:hypothetical protein
MKSRHPEPSDKNSGPGPGAYSVLPEKQLPAFSMRMKTKQDDSTYAATTNPMNFVKTTVPGDEKFVY